MLKETPSNGVEDGHPPALVDQVAQVVRQIQPASRAHTLVLSGELDRTTAYTLEVTLEQLRERGCRLLRIDLRALEHIDWIGVAVITFQTELWRRDGRSVSLIPGPRAVQEVFVLEGHPERLLFEAAREPWWGERPAATPPRTARPAEPRPVPTPAPAPVRRTWAPRPRRGPAIATLTFTRWRPQP